MLVHGAAEPLENKALLQFSAMAMCWAFKCFGYHGGGDGNGIVCDVRCGPWQWCRNAGSGGERNILILAMMLLLGRW